MILVDQFEKTVSIKNKKQKRKHETFEKVLKSVISENETQNFISFINNSFMGNRPPSLTFIGMRII